MKKVYLVLRHELITTLRRRSFLLVAFGIPLLALLVFVGVTIFRGGSPNSGVIAPEAAATSELEVQGYVDQAGLISVIPQDIPDGYLLAYPDEDHAQQALEGGEIAAYYVVPEDYVETGDLNALDAAGQRAGWRCRVGRPGLEPGESAGDEPGSRAAA